MHTRTIEQHPRAQKKTCEDEPFVISPEFSSRTVSSRTLVIVSVPSSRFVEEFVTTTSRAMVKRKIDDSLKIVSALKSDLNERSLRISCQRSLVFS